MGHSPQTRGFSRRDVRNGRARLGALIAGLASIAACMSAAPGTIGAGLGLRTDHRLFVRTLPPGEGANRAGIEVDDEIVAIEGKDVRTLSPEDVRRSVRGDVGSTLTVTIQRGDERRDVKIVRTPLLAGKSPEKKP